MKLAKRFIPKGWELVDPDIEGEIRLEYTPDDKDTYDEWMLSIEFNKLDKNYRISYSESSSSTSFNNIWDGNRNDIAKLSDEAVRLMQVWRAN